MGDLLLNFECPISSLLTLYLARADVRNGFSYSHTLAIISILFEM